MSVLCVCVCTLVPECLLSALVPLFTRQLHWHLFMYVCVVVSMCVLSFAYSLATIGNCAETPQSML